MTSCPHCGAALSRQKPIWLAFECGGQLVKVADTIVAQPAACSMVSLTGVSHASSASGSKDALNTPNKPLRSSP
jgi:hypothetical protein